MKKYISILMILVFVMVCSDMSITAFAQEKTFTTEDLEKYKSKKEKQITEEDKQKESEKKLQRKERQIEMEEKMFKKNTDNDKKQKIIIEKH